MPSSTRWRINFSASTTGYLYIAEIEMAISPGGSDQCIGGTATSSTNTTPYYPTNAFDDNTSTIWLNGTVLSTAAQWLEYQFITAVDIVEYRIQVLTSDFPTAWTFEYYNGSTWIIVDTRSGIGGWSANEKRTYSVIASTTNGQISQLPVEVLLTASSPSGRISQLPVEVLLGPIVINGSISQLPVEVLLTASPPNGQISQLPIEVLISTTLILPTSVESSQAFFGDPIGTA